MEREKEELVEQKTETQSIEIISSEIGQDKKKQLYLKYFPAYEEIVKECFGDTEEIESILKAQKKDCCIYCGNVHVRRYGQEDFFVCEDCRKWFMINQQDFFEAVILVKKNLEVLLGIVFKERVMVDCKVVRYQWQKRKRRKSIINVQGSKTHFGQDWVNIKSRNGKIEFVVFNGLPKPTFIFIVVTYFVDVYFKNNKSNIIVRTLELWNCLEIDALVKWYAIHYMYLNGYANFCRWCNEKELEDVNYKKWELVLGSPVTKRVMSEHELANILIRKTKMF